MTFEIVSEYNVNPTIKGVFTDCDCKQLMIDGVNFGEKPKVYLDQVLLSITACGDDFVIAKLPEELSPGGFRIKVVRMPETTAGNHLGNSSQRTDPFSFPVNKK